MYKSSLKKKDIINNLTNKTGYPINFSKKLIEDILEILVKTINSGSLNLKNIGSFKIIKKKERMGRNPKTRVKFIIKSRNAISFTPSKKLFEININE